MQDFEDEEWRPIENFDHYLVSNYGRVRRANKDQPREISISDQGFPIITLYAIDSKTRYLRQINKLVAQAFLPPPALEEERAVWHLDGNLRNCHVSNLRWDTRGRVLAWNAMHRRGKPALATPKVRNNRTGITYNSAYECGMAEGELEDTIVWKTEKGHPRYSYVF